MNQGMTVQQVIMALQEHDPEALLLAGANSPMSISWVQVPECVTLHVKDERTPAVLLGLGVPVQISKDPLPPETITVEIPRETAQWYGALTHPGEYTGQVAEACRKALQDGDGQ